LDRLSGLLSELEVHAVFILPLILSANGPVLTGSPKQPSRAEAVCDEQLGDFLRDEAKVYCNVEGIIYEGREYLGPAAPAGHRCTTGRQPHQPCRTLNDSHPDPTKPAIIWYSIQR